MRRATLLLLLCAGAASAGIDQTAEKIDQLRRDNGAPAVAVVMVDRNGLLLHRAYGVMDLASDKPADADTRFRAGSITKAFTGLALLRAETQGLLKLDQPVHALAPGATFRNPWENTSPLRLAQLLEHSAGWYDMSGAEFDSSDATPLTLAQALALSPASRSSHWPPGLHSEYSNSGPGLAAYVLEQRCACRYEDFMRSRVFEPLGMESASLLADKTTQEHLAQGYERDGKTPLPYWHVLYRAAAGLNLNPRDMGNFLRMLLNRGKFGIQSFLSPQQVTRFEHPQTTLAARNGLDFGYGLGIRQYQHDGHSLFGHGGDADGYLSHFAYSLDSGRGYFVVITADKSALIDEMQEMLDDWLVENTPRPEAPPAASLSDEQLRALTGDYFAATTRFPQANWQQQKLRVYLSQKQLFAETSDIARMPLIPVDAKRFRRPWETVATSIFVVQPDGSMVLQGPMGNWLKKK